MKKYKVGDKVHVCDSYDYYEGEVIEAVYVDIPEYRVRVNDSNEIIFARKFIASTKEELEKRVEEYNDFVKYLS